MLATVRALRRADGAVRAAAFHLVAVLIDDHPLPTHDEVAWRCARASLRSAPESPLYRREAARRTVFRTPYAQLPRSLGNLFLYAALVMLQVGRRVPPALLLLGPLSVPLLLPGVLLHLMTNGVVLPLSGLLEARLAKRLLAAPEDETLVGDLERMLES